MSAFSMKQPLKNYKEIDNQKYVARITKTLYYGQFPKRDRLSLPVTELAAELFSEAQCGKSLKRLHLNTAARISRKASVSPCHLIIAMLYLDKLKTRNPEYLEQTKPSNLFLVSLMISSKYLFDDGESNGFLIYEWAATGKLIVCELVQLEREFLEAIDWDIYVNEIVFWKKLNQLEMQLAQKEGNQRGYFTYTELLNLATIIEVHALIQCVFTMMMILIATYTASVLTIAGSFHLVTYIPGNALQNRYSENILYQAKLVNTVGSNDCVKYTDEGIVPQVGERNVEPVHILRTSLFLASINTFMVPYNNITGSEVDSEVDIEAASWEWWKIPSMIWLSESSKDYNMKEYITLRYFYKYFMSYLESLFVSSSNLEMGHHVNMKKATKTRIQDQLEGSWHKEWTDSIEQEIFHSPYVPNIKFQEKPFFTL